MNFNEAVKLIELESIEGVAYTSRFGQYPDKAHISQILLALKVIKLELQGKNTISRKLARALFVINDAYQGNMNGATSKDIKLDQHVFDGFIVINELMYEIFEDQSA